MTKEEWDFILAMLSAYETGQEWNFWDPTTTRVLKKFREFAAEEKDAASA